MAQRRRPDPRHHRGLSNLPQGLIEQLASSARRIPEVTKLIVFGSYARNEAGPQSDLDLCVLYNGDEGDAIDIVSRADAQLYPILHSSGIEYDLVGFPDNMYRHVRPRGARPLLDSIEKEGVELCSNN